MFLSSETKCSTWLCEICGDYLKHPRDQNLRMEYMSDDGLNFASFNELIWKASSQSSLHSSSREEAWMLGENNLVFGSNSPFYDDNLPFHSPKRAIFTISLPCTQILVVNSTACELLNYSSDELCSMKLQSIVQDNYKYKLLTIDDSSESGYKKEKMVELIGKDGDAIPVSMFFKRIDSPQRCLAVAEPVDRKSVVIIVNTNGKILTCDEDAGLIFHYESSELVGADIRDLVPNIALGYDGDNKYEMLYKQRLTGRSKSGCSFPLCLTITRNGASQESWQIVIWVYLNLSGLIIVNRDLRITNCNYKFTKLLFGAAKEHVSNQKITKFIPSFSDDIKNINNNDFSFQNENSELSPRNKSRKFRPPVINSRKRAKENDPKGSDNTALVTSNYSTCKPRSSPACADRNHVVNDYERKGKQLPKESLLKMRLSKSDYNIHLGCEIHNIHVDEKSVSSQEMESAGHGFASANKSEDEPRQKEYCLSSKHLGLREGYFSGYGRHFDGSDIDIFYKIKIISFGDKQFYCIWISRDSLECSDSGANVRNNVVGSSSLNSNSMDEYGAKEGSFNDDMTTPSSASMLSHNDDLLTAGDYSENYTNIEQIGKGAYGYVKLAFRHVDGLLVVTKFIKRYKINVQSWIFDPKWNTKVPLEISLLTNLRHPNIVEVMDVFHNDSFFQLVMKKHGAGMDLFEFIERKPKSDEKLNSYIFRQIISAIQYLDSIGILHRDIKDENVIINERFEVKLIDFGSAAFRPNGRMFSVFYGTVEYCSPEVLQGNRYRGPELEIWSLGVTLYVLTFGENPFFDIQETIKGKFSISVPISSYLYDLLHKMLEKDVESRINILKVSTHPWILQPVDIDKYRFEDVVHCSPAESDPPRYITEFTFEKYHENDHNLESDCERTMASTNTFCSLQTTENTENFDQYDEKLQDFGSEFLMDDSLFKSSTPIASCSKTAAKNREDVTKSVGALNQICESYKSQIRDGCNYNSFVKKRFSLDVNLLQRLNYSRRYSDSESSFDQMGTVGTEEAFSEKLELELINDLDEMKIMPSGREFRRSRGCESPGCSAGCMLEGSKSAAERDRTASRETEESNLTGYPEFYDTSDSRSFDEDSEFFWDAENDKSKSSDHY